ncbi:unnamed protein product [Echinostoma caproni]|uniref:SCP domain-containing protein n=1 Tax=Echinostoma caproni TaxID=27848 RepID=A0A183B220_9TREM|nr:unnamed protein product [Echinostoma caproni]
MKSFYLTILSLALAGLAVSITVDEKNLLLRLHNAARTRILNCSVPGQPPARSMQMLKWHDGLSKKAQQWSDRCITGHDKNDDRKLPEFWWVGQNFAGFPSVEPGFNAWFDEYKQYNFMANTCSGVCGHYTQLVWADTEYVGCGVTKCTKPSFPYGYSIVCNYGLGGNMNGARPYTAGTLGDCRKTSKSLLYFY